MKFEQVKGVLSLVLLSFIFASMGVFARFLDTEFEVFQQTYLRIAIAFIISVIIFSPYINYKKIFSLPKRDLFVIILRACFLYAAVILITYALLIGKYSNASFVAAIPILPLIGYFVLKETISKKMFFYILIAFFGAGCIIFQDFDFAIFDIASLYALLSAILFDISMVLRKFHSNYLSNYETTSLMFFIATIFLLIGSFIFLEGVPQIEQFSIPMVLILTLSAIANVLIIILINYGFEHVKASVAGNILTLEVLFALMYGVLLYQEYLNFFEIVGSVLILVSILLVNHQENKENKERKV